MKTNQEIYDVITSGNHSYKLWKRGNKRATRIYKDGIEMRVDIGYYLISRECEIIIHHSNALVWRILTSDKPHPRCG